MKDVLHPIHAAIVRTFAASSVLLAFDYDGTLAPIVKDPDQAWMRPRTRGLLADVANRYPCAIISGRARADVLLRLDGVDIVGVIGNHGLEPSSDTATYAREVAGWLPSLQHRLAGLTNVVIENKVVSLSIHYRNCPDHALAHDAIRDAVATLDGARVLGGKLVFNVLPGNAPNKGLALLDAQRTHRCDTAIYVGDDQTDEDVFALGHPGKILGIRVEPSSTSQAPYYLRAQSEIDDLLELLIACRPVPARSTDRQASG